MSYPSRLDFKIELMNQLFYFNFIAAIILPLLSPFQEEMAKELTEKTNE